MENTIDLNNPAVRDRVEYLGQQAERSIMADFVTRHPELLNAPLDADIRNKQVIDAVMTQNGLALTPENLEWSYRVALDAGQLNLPMYSAAEEAAFPQMSTAQMRDYLRQRYQAPRPPNAAELLPTSGERMWSADTVAMDEEALVALREKLMGIR